MTLMNAEERERFLASLREDADFRADVRRELLTEELLNLPQTVAVLVDTAAQQRQDFVAMAQSVANYMERTISAVQEGFALVRTELGDVRTELHTELGTMRTQMDAGFTSVQAKFDQVDADLQDIRDQLAS
jgi:hypothetical protein